MSCVCSVIPTHVADLHFCFMISYGISSAVDKYWLRKGFRPLVIYKFRFHSLFCKVTVMAPFSYTGLCQVTRFVLLDW